MKLCFKEDFSLLSTDNMSRKELIAEVIFRLSITEFEDNFHLWPYIVQSENLLEKEQIIIISDALFDSKLKNHFKSKNIKLIPLSKHKFVPPITFYILKHFDLPNLQNKIIKKIFKKKDNALKRAFFQHR